MLRELLEDCVSRTHRQVRRMFISYPTNINKKTLQTARATDRSVENIPRDLSVMDMKLIGLFLAGRAQGWGAFSVASRPWNRSRRTHPVACTYAPRSLTARSSSYPAYCGSSISVELSIL
mmetsp:Transcript_49881/g.131266  ORF Transcript_49881/g.131266 Transcript_49881/m.131266 type:complete len:120 (-) Transcript_49881:59-418(-)